MTGCKSSKWGPGGSPPYFYIFLGGVPGQGPPAPAPSPPAPEPRPPAPSPEKEALVSTFENPFFKCFSGHSRRYNAWSQKRFILVEMILCTMTAHYAQFPSLLPTILALQFPACKL